MLDRPLGPLDAPGKINLRLAVLGRRPDGYHELEMLNFPLALADRLTIEPTDRPGVEVRCEHPGVPLGPENLVCRAAASLAAALAAPLALRITIDKGVPVQAGLGGGSSDAAVVLAALHRALGEPLRADELIGLAAEIGADVPFFLAGRACWAHGIGERLTPLGDYPELALVLLKPDFGVATAWAYGQWRGGLTSACAQATLPLSFPDWGSLIPLLRNDLEPGVSAVHPAVARLRDMLFEAGALHASMTGSGPTVFGVFSSVNQAEQARLALMQAAPGLWSAVTTTR